MKLDAIALALLYLLSPISASVVQDTNAHTESHALDSRSDAQGSSFSPRDTTHSLERRKGGGGRGGGGGFSGGVGSSGTGGSGRGSGGTSGGTSGSNPRTGGSSNVGGATAGGSGVRPSYGGYYAGGASQPFRAGASPGRVAPYVLGGAALGFLPFAFIAAGSAAYLYHYDDPVTYYNQTAGRQETNPVNCVCEKYQECGCADNNNSDYIESVIGNGSYAAMAANNVTALQNGTIYIDGTLANGTTAAGGADAVLNPRAGVAVITAAVLAVVLSAV